jgi:hypothetical protein
MKSIKDFIREYLNSVAELGNLYNQPHSLKDWNKILESGGYIRVEFNVTHGDTRRVAQWCREKFGADHYYWTGGAFWFETEKAAVLFALRWV